MRASLLKAIGTVLALTLFIAVSGCGAAEDEDLAAVKREPLASTRLLGMEATTSVEGDRDVFGDAYVFREFESDELSGRTLLMAIQKVALDSDWVTWECRRDGGNNWALRMGRGSPGFWADIQVYRRWAVVKVGKNRPGTHSFVPEEPNTSC